MTRDQRIVAIGAASGVAAMVAAFAVIYRLWPIDRSLVDPAHRLAYALQLDAFAALPLLVAVIVVGNNRFLSMAATGYLNVGIIAFALWTIVQPH